MALSAKVIVVLIVTLFLVACSSNSVVDEGLEDSNSVETYNEGGEELHDVYAEYSFCYDTGSYDPTLRYKCEMPLTYKECVEWMSQQEGQGKTVFYANFSGGEPTQPGRTANQYYMTVHFGDQTQQTDTQTVFKNIPSEFMMFVDDNCYPNATVEIYNTNDVLMDVMTLEYTLD